jgi:hypothetical protein
MGADPKWFVFSTRPLLFDWYVGSMGIKEKNITKDTCSQEIGLRLQSIKITTILVHSMVTHIY